MISLTPLEEPSMDPDTLQYASLKVPDFLFHQVHPRYGANRVAHQWFTILQEGAGSSQS